MNCGYRYVTVVYFFFTPKSFSCFLELVFRARRWAGLVGFVGWGLGGVGSGLRLVALGINWAVWCGWVAYR